MLSRTVATSLRALVVATLVLGLGSCSTTGSDDASVPERTATTAAPEAGGSVADYTEAIVANLSEGSVAEGHFVLAVEPAACVAPTFIEVITVERLQEAGIDPEEVADPYWDGTDLGLTPDDGQAIVDALHACDVDTAAFMAEALADGLTADQSACVADAIDPDLADAVLVKTFSTGEADAEGEALVADLRRSCDLPEN